MICLIGNVLKERYCIVEQLGHGGGGSLYLAKDMELGICRAVKEIPIAKKKEARLMQYLEYPAIPKIIDYMETLLSRISHRLERLYNVMQNFSVQGNGFLYGKSLLWERRLPEYWNIFTVGSHQSVTGI